MYKHATSIIPRLCNYTSKAYNIRTHNYVHLSVDTTDVDDADISYILGVHANFGLMLRLEATVLTLVRDAAVLPLGVRVA